MKSPIRHDTGGILLVDDDRELRFILGARLRAAGYFVLEAGDGHQACTMAVTHRPDLVVMDVGLPIMDGIAATRALKGDARTEAIPVIMLTARSNTADLVRGLEAGAQEYLVKPFDVTEFMARIRTVHRLATARSDLDRLNARLEAEIREKTRRLQELYEFMRDLNHAKSREDILDLLLKAVVNLTQAQRVSLLLKDDSGKLDCRRSLGQYPDHDSRPDARWSTPLVSTSLETQDGSIGVINVAHKPDGTPFSEEEIECIRSVADAGAIALDNIVRRSRLQQSVRVLLQTLGHLAEYRDEETTQHLGRVAHMARVLAEELRNSSEYAAQVTDEYIDDLVLAAPMHDIGKVGIPDEILTKPGKLTDEEFNIMKTHTDIGRRVLSRAVDPSCPNPLLHMCIDIAYGHHERFNGRGYPRRLAGRNIPLAARIIALVDAYDAMTSPRRYKEAQSHEWAVNVVRQESGKHFDPVIVEAFLRCQDRFDELRAKGEEPALAENPWSITARS